MQTSINYQHKNCSYCLCPEASEQSDRAQRCNHGQGWQLPPHIDTTCFFQWDYEESNTWCAWEKGWTSTDAAFLSPDEKEPFTNKSKEICFHWRHWRQDNNSCNFLTFGVEEFKQMTPKRFWSFLRSMSESQRNTLRSVDEICFGFRDHPDVLRMIPIPEHARLWERNFFERCCDHLVGQILVNEMVHPHVHKPWILAKALGTNLWLSCEWQTTRRQCSRNKIHKRNANVVLQSSIGFAGTESWPSKAVHSISLCPVSLSARPHVPTRVDFSLADWSSPIKSTRVSSFVIWRSGGSGYVAVDVSILFVGSIRAHDRWERCRE